MIVSSKLQTFLTTKYLSILFADQMIISQAIPTTVQSSLSSINMGQSTVESMITSSNPTTITSPDQPRTTAPNQTMITSKNERTPGLRLDFFKNIGNLRGS
ncbi:unnamed protein product, partial [Rotaria magnacalcarata]